MEQTGPDINDPKRKELREFGDYLVEQLKARGWEYIFFLNNESGIDNRVSMKDSTVLYVLKVFIKTAKFSFFKKLYLLFG